MDGGVQRSSSASQSSNLPSPRSLLMHGSSSRLRDDDHLSAALMSADGQQPVRDSNRIDRIDRIQSASQLSTAGLEKGSLAREVSAPDSLNRQQSTSVQRPISRSGSRTGTSFNIPLSTQHPSSLLSAAGERVRAYSDSAREQERLEGGSRQYTDSSHFVPPVDKLSPQRESEEFTPLSSHTPSTIHQAPIQPLPTAEQVNLIAFVNFNSGGKTGRRMAQVMQEVLGKGNVYDLADRNPTAHLEKHLHTPYLRVAICGGDGTVNWLLSCIGALPFNPLPAVGILPLGTGNDTARAFGWGHKYPGKNGVIRNLQRMRTAPVVAFDRWHATVDHYEDLTDAQVKGFPAAMREMKEEPHYLGYRPPQKQRDDPVYQAVVGASRVEMEHRHEAVQNGGPEQASGAIVLPAPVPAQRRSSGTTVFSLNLPPSSISEGEEFKATPFSPSSRLVRRELQFNNYLSFGIDAQIQFEFHEHRESNRHLYVSRVVNMAWTTYWGAVNLFCCQARQLVVKLEVPDLETGEWKEMVVPPNIRSIVLLNGTTYAAGRHIWGQGRSGKDEYSGPPPSYNDGLLEVMGTESTLHLSMMLINVRRAIRIAQVHEVRITMDAPIHAQIDGEPWAEQSSVYHIRRLQQALMIDGKKHKKGYYPGRDI